MRRGYGASYRASSEGPSARTRACSPGCGPPRGAAPCEAGPIRPGSCTGARLEGGCRARGSSGRSAWYNSSRHAWSRAAAPRRSRRRARRGRRRELRVSWAYSGLFALFSNANRALTLAARRRRLGLVAAQVADRAAPAFGPPRLADVAAVQDEEVVRVAAEGRRRHPVELPLHRQHVLARREAGAVRDPEDVGVDREGLGAEGAVHHHVGGLAADAGQGLERVEVGGHLA